jgi:catechol 2,3-dioxygenase-like lactoylglutathione lyase family enzyme
MAGIMGAHHTSFTVADLDRSLAFFRDALDLEVVFVRDVRADYFDRVVGLRDCEVRAALLKVPHSEHHVELFQYVRPSGEVHRPRPCDPGSAHLALLVDDLHGLVKQLREKGADAGEPVEITAGPNRGGCALYLRDPNGILIELFQRPPPKP